MGTKTMKNWALITRANATAYRKELPLILEAHAYVAAEAATKPAKKKTAAKSAPAKKAASRKPRSS
jgi:hypothetical protein